MFAATSLCRRPGAAVSGRELSTRPRARASTACTRGARVQAVATATAADAPATAPSLPYRVGHGWDLHRLEEGYPLIIGGIDIPHVVGCVAHSDGDVLLHTVVDAVLGALCLPDIGQLFPDNDPQWKGARSDIFLKEAIRLMKERDYIIGNIDCTIIAQKPKLSPHKEAIRQNICKLLEADPSVVNIKVLLGLFVICNVSNCGPRHNS
mmetsp:Transcript_23140/g.58365  ORF Transcript_23140/g.58365 Transcript_23140/m.58365 type:complete len:208 (+) Transcript_23140:82-705(+)